MTTEGPQLDALVHRLADCPPAFLDDPRMEAYYDDGETSGTVDVPAVIGDLFVDYGVVPEPTHIAPFRGAAALDVNWLKLTMVTSWLARDRWFVDRPQLFQRVRRFLADEGLKQLARLVEAETFVTNAERREELARLLLHALDLRPAGESEDQAEDRLQSVSTVSREAVLAEMREKRERARKLREEMAKKRAREAATRYSRE